MHWEPDHPPHSETLPECCICQREAKEGENLTSWAMIRRPSCTVEDVRPAAKGGGRVRARVRRPWRQSRHSNQAIG